MSLTPANAEEEARFKAAVDNLLPSIQRAREVWEFAGRAYATFSSRPDWPEHQAAVELILNLASVDYEVKVLLHQFHADFDNRAVWEKYLGLTLYEGITTVKTLAGANSKRLRQSEGDSSPKLANLRKGLDRFNAEVRPIRGDSDFWSLLKRLRNEVTAHHIGKRDSAMSLHVSWAIASEESRTKAHHSNMSTIAQRSLFFGRAVQNLAEDLNRQA